MIDPNEELLARQLKREKDSATAGYDKFIKNQQEQCRLNNGSNTSFSIYFKAEMLPKLIKRLQEKLDDISRIRESNVKIAIRKCVADARNPKGDLKHHDHWDLEIAAFLTFQMTLDNALNPNKESRLEASKHGGDKRVLRKKTYTELQREIGKVVNEQLTLRIILKSFPDWFRRKSQHAERSHEEGLKSTTSYWSYRMRKAMKDLEAELEENQDFTGLDIVRNRNPWTSEDRSQVGAWLLTTVIEVTGMFNPVTEREGKRSDTYIYLADAFKQKRDELHEACEIYQTVLLPMLIPPQPITNESMGGWINEALHHPDRNPKGSIVLSDRHLEFINRQAQVQFQVNPFTQNLFKELINQNKSLGKFFYYERQVIPEVNQMLGLGALSREEQNAKIAEIKAVDPERIRRLRAEHSEMLDRDKAKAKKSVLARKLVETTKMIIDDEALYIPMSFDMRGRVYSRVPFVSFQSADPGRYLLRFAQKTPTDTRTEFWLMVGISNAAGNDKLSMGDRVQWFHRHKDQIINVGKMLDGGDFTSAYEFLNQDEIDDPFCLAALANEYVKVFVDKTQDYTQCYVCVDASCSGSAIFNAWRRNRTGGQMVNLTDNDAPADIYTEVWKRIKVLAKEQNIVFDPEKVAALEETKLIRKMMKQAFVPAQYASPENRQFYTLTRFNNSKLKKLGLQFTDAEMSNLKKLWSEALDDVSSISTVVEWFQNRTQEALDAGANEICYTSCNGSRMTLKYPKFKEKKIRTLHYGQAKWREQRQQEATTDINVKKMLNAITANVTHLTDAAALCEAMYAWEQPMVCIHDAVGVPIGSAVDEAISNLKDGFIEATKYNVWDQFRQDNNLPIEPRTSGQIVGDLKLAEIKDSTYLFS
jgi:hypothetical protein